MFTDAKAFSGFSVNDLDAAKAFYSQVLGIEVDEQPMGLFLKLKSGSDVYIYQKDNHTPASFTILNFPVDDIDKAIDELTEKGVVFEQYDMPGMEQDEKGVLRGRTAHMGPDIAWFEDPAGNVLAVLQES